MSEQKTKQRHDVIEKINNSEQYLDLSCYFVYELYTMYI